MSNLYLDKETRQKLIRSKSNGRTYILFKPLSAAPGRDTKAPTQEEAEALIAALDKCNMAAQHVLDGMDTNLRLLRECRIEAQAAHQIVANSNASARIALASFNGEAAV